MSAVFPTRALITRRWRGTLVCVMIALASTFVSEHYGGPQLLYALLIGLAFHFLYGNPQIAVGVDFCGRTLLRLGVALLGARISVEQVAHLGWPTAAVIVCAVALTIGCGALMSRLLKRPLAEGILSGGAVGICGASAALAISSVLPATRETERVTLLNVVGVTVFSTLAMVLYPFLLRLADLNPIQSGIFLGGTIHDVAQVVAAGMLLGRETADTATVVKLFRVLLLLPIVFCISLAYRGCGTLQEGAKNVPMVPSFLIAFVALVIVASTGVLPPAVVAGASDASRWLLVIAIAAAGVKTSFEDLLQLGWKPIAMLAVETVFIALFVLTAILVLHLGLTT
ncbi:MAG: putative sulfate exporter family transporter [Oxalobacteraceae bacterium]|jgi:uncharacterized integral membrane protein (TIGR00698 family)|nr:MAG: putative sulfate exporter family transporter [Oxalobacteraceae bacterium]